MGWEAGAGEQPPQHHPSSSHLLEQSNTKSGHAFFHRAGAFWVTCGWGGAGGLPHTRCVPCCQRARAGWEGASCHREMCCGCWAACGTQR